MKTREKKMPQLPELEQLRRELRRVRYRTRYIKMLRSTLGLLAVTAAAVLMAVTLWLPVLRIVGNSMAPAMENGDIVVCIRGREPAPGELVSFYLGNRLLVKRCIAVAGQQVDLDEAGHVFVDGVRLEEPYIPAPARGDGDVELPCTVPEGQFFCLGDNRTASVDSRHSQVGLVSREQLSGAPVLRVWPLHRFGLLE